MTSHGSIVVIELNCCVVGWADSCSFQRSVTSVAVDFVNVALRPTPTSGYSRSHCIVSN